MVPIDFSITPPSTQWKDRHSRVAWIYGECEAASSITAATLGLGDKDQAFAWLDKAYEDRAFFLGDLQVEPDPLRSDPRFQDLVRRMNFPH